MIHVQGIRIRVYNVSTEMKWDGNNHIVYTLL